VAGYLATAVDVTPRRRAELHQDLVYAAERTLSQGASVDEDAASILELLCRRQEWDVGELWSSAFEEEQPRCVKRWSSDRAGTSEATGQTLDGPAIDGCVGAVWVADIAVDERFAGSPEARELALHGMLRLPVPMQGPGQASVRLYSRDARARDDAVIAVAACVAARLGRVLEGPPPTGEKRSTTPRKAAILDALPDAVVTVDHEGRVVELNAAAEALYGFPPGHALGRAFKDLVVPRRGRKRFQERFEQQASHRRGHMSARFDSPALKADGSPFPAQFAMATLAHREPPCVTICVWDDTKRKQAEDAVTHYRERVQSLMRELLLAEDRERKRLARDLHDGLSQTIALAQIKLSALRASKSAAIDGPLGEVQELMERADQAARSIGFELSPLVLHDLGLEAALQWLAENIHERYGTVVDVKRDGPVIRTDEPTRVIVFRAIRELVINAAKHAGVQLVRVYVECGDGRLEVAVRDDGIGIDPDTAPSEGFGLLSVRERLAHIGGQMTIDSMRGKGTAVCLSAPLRDDRPNNSRTELR
jgi:PAS domain S-box-containing protein